MLKSAQQLPIALKQKGAIGTRKIDNNLRALSKIGVDRRVCADAVLQTKSSLLNGVA